MIHKNLSRGMTLIEVAVAVAIVALLACVALPTYATYSTRSRVSECIQLLGPAKQAVSMSSTDYTFSPTRNCASIEIQNDGVIIATTRDTGAAIDPILQWTPHFSGGISWTCGLVQGKPSDVPEICRGAPVAGDGTQLADNGSGNSSAGGSSGSGSGAGSGSADSNGGSGDNGGSTPPGNPADPGSASSGGGSSSGSGSGSGSDNGSGTGNGDSGSGNSGSDNGSGSGSGSDNGGGSSGGSGDSSGGGSSSGGGGGSSDPGTSGSACSKNNKNKNKCKVPPGQCKKGKVNC